MSAPNTQYMRISGTGFTSAGLSVGSNIMVDGSTANNGLYTITSITSDSLYEYAGLSGLTLTDETNGSGIGITNVTVGGNKIVCFGDEDSGVIKTWSYNNSSSTTGTVLDAPSVGTSGWSSNAIKPLINGSNCKYIFTPGQSAIRVCDTNISNNSVIKHYSYIAKQNFGSEGRLNAHFNTYAGFYEHSNTLSPPSSGGYINKPPDEKEAYGIDEDGASTIKTSLHLRRSLAKSDSSGNYETSTKHFCELAEQGTTASDLDITATQKHMFLSSPSSASKIPLDAVIGTCNKPRLAWDGAATFGTEYMLVRNIDPENQIMNVYRGYVGSLAQAIDDETQKYLVQYGCGFNYRVVESYRSGGYVEGTYEFAQSFIYDGNQESLLRTPSQMQFGGSSNKMDVSGDLKALDIDVYAFGPYNGRVTGGRIYIREKNSDEAWALLVDIDLVKGARTSMGAEYDSWASYKGTDGIPAGCFYVDDLISKNPQIDRYVDMNNYYPEIKRNSIGRNGESYQCSTTGGERAWVGNVKLAEESGIVERYGDRIMYSEFGKYDVFPHLNYFTSSKGDAEDVNAIKYFSDKLIIFKTRTVHIWDVSSLEPFNWAPIQTIKYAGVTNHYSIATTPYGVAWANKTGCYFYNGESVEDLTENKIKDSENAYHGASTPPSWEAFIKSSDYSERPMVTYSPKDKQLYVLKDVAGGTNSNYCYIYNFTTKSWVFNTSIFSNGEQYTNTITDWNGNVVLATDNFSTPTAITTLKESSANFKYDYQELITSTDDSALSGSSTNWVDYSPATSITSPGFDASLDRLAVTGTNTTTATDKEGVSLPVAQVDQNDTVTITAGRFYTITATLWSQTTMEGVPFYFEFWNSAKTIGEITTVQTVYSVTVLASSSADLRIYKKMKNSEFSSNYGNVQWYIKNISVKEASLYLQDTDKFTVGDYVKVNTEWFQVKGINYASTDHIIVKGGQFGTTLANHSSGVDDEDEGNAVMASMAVFKELSTSSSNLVAPKLITKDIDFARPGVVKKIYNIFVTYKNTNSSTRNNIIKVATDGNTTWAQANITSSQSVNNSASAAITPTLTGSFVGNKTSWDIAKFSFNKPIQCQSISLYINDGGASTGLFINDITFEYKIIHRRVS